MSAADDTREFFKVCDERLKRIVELEALLAATEAERDEARTQLADYANVSGEQYDYDTLLFKYGEKSRALREYEGYARDLRAREAALRVSLSDARDQLQRGVPIGIEMAEKIIDAALAAASPEGEK
jgi:hypothetical protein